MTTSQDLAKQDAARRAVDLVRSGMVLGLGTGSTAKLAVDEIGRRLAAGDLHDIVGVPTSEATERQAAALGIPLSTLDRHPRVELTIDGADEVDPHGRLIKGGGGALLREKIVATASRRLAIVVDASKLVERLGATFPVPIEVTPFGWTTHLDPIRALGGEPVLRARDGTPYRTDGGNLILDVTFAGGLADPEGVAAAIRARPGVVETGLFLGFSPEVIVGHAR
ncbi:Ribose-5-phosphate isomerase A [Gemmatirosa kalamazoonensis]|uniref:Ribose-5-phosphate isomerase A n=1 Tax=Gemmatirosa kalamazoonensis TaxID=861299 RepID=W0RDQ8_9BACT|nr:ribose-5-phosphate isomerase RpiA [Gemmatirosa kalamazoonensis]AHG88941.1 Ribose-5-phosphate isomerase A [Gemmatirosa kalamazoonensis]